MNFKQRICLIFIFLQVLPQDLHIQVSLQFCSHPYDDLVSRSADNVVRFNDSFNILLQRKRQYKRKIAAWHFDKNVKDEEMKIILWMQRTRKLDQGKDSVFYVRSQLVKASKIARYARRKKTPENSEAPQTSMSACQ